jgi:hypothetical protein
MIVLALLLAITLFSQSQHEKRCERPTSEPLLIHQSNTYTAPLL